MALACVAAGDAAASGPCVAVGRWTAPAGSAPIAHDAMIDAMASRAVVLLGESHTDAADHRWQLQTVAALHGRRPEMVLGFESFPRRVQGVLDRWVAGELTEDGFLKAVEWNGVWGIDPALYMPLFQFARMNRVPMVALNVERALVSKVGRQGWDAVPANEREGVETPARPLPSYRARLAGVFAHHRQDAGAPPADDDPAFGRFVAAQLTWDRAMAQAVAAARARAGAPLVVGIVGRGHVEYGHGIPWQLGDLGINDVGVLLTWPADDDCGGLIGPDGRAVANAVFGIAPEPDDDPDS